MFQDGIETTPHGVGPMAVVLHKNQIEEPSVAFIIKDITDTDWGKSRYNCSLPLSSAVVDLYETVAKVTGGCG